MPVLLLLVLWAGGVSDEPQSPVLVELFTSQGCSSCPPADRLLSDWQAQDRPSVILLAYHVDYWNRLGWRDPFSRAEFSDRQRDYGDVLPSRVYTPQMVVGGKAVLVGSNRAAAEQALTQMQAAKQAIGVQLEVTKQGEKLNVAYTLSGELDAKTRVHVALVSDHLKTKVRRGENAGRDLVNTAVVRRWKTVPAKERGQVMVPLTAAFEGDLSRVVLWVQQGQVGRVLGVSQVDYDG